MLWQREVKTKKPIVDVNFLCCRINRVSRRHLTEVLRIHNILNDEGENGKQIFQS